LYEEIVFIKHRFVVLVVILLFNSGEGSKKSFT